jgi:DNA end-binding protein Ku
MAVSSWKGFITFGLVAVPIRLFPAARYAHIRFHEVHKKCGHRVQQQLYCPYDKEVVSRDEIVMGYETDDDKMVIVDPKELKALEPASSTAMEISQFVKLAEVDPIYFETSYFSVPEPAGAHAYGLLLEALEELEIAALAQVTMHQRERTVIIRPFRNGLTAHTLYNQGEIHDVAGYGKKDSKEANSKELALAEQFAKTLIEPFRPERFHNEYQDRVRQLIESKSKGQAGPTPEKGRKLAPVIDLMDALKKSLANKEARSGGKAAEQGSAKNGKRKKTA